MKDFRYAVLVMLVASCDSPGGAALGQKESALNANTPVTWVGQVNTTVNGTTITKTGGQPDEEDAGAVSQQSIASGDAAFQFTVDDASRFRFVGFGHTATWQGAANIDFSFRLQSGHADAYEHNTYQTDILVTTGDVMKVEIVGGVARYYKNGALQFTSSQAPVYPLYVITSMIDAGSTIAQAQTSAGGGGATAGHELCGWLTGVGNDAATDPYFNDFAANASYFDAVHPTWWSVNDGNGGNCCTGGGTFCEGFGNPASTHAGCASTQVTANTTYSGKRTKLIPMVAATSSGQVAIVRAMLANPATQDQWVATLVNYAQTWRYDGYDIDFEHLDDNNSHPEVRAQLVTFMGKLANALHPLGKTVSMAVDGFAGSDADTQWDIDSLLNVADELHVMGYDYHGMFSSHPGPVDPLGWATAAMTHMASVAGTRTPKLIWGLPNYGIEGPDGQQVTPEIQQGLHVWLANHPGYATTSSEMATCPLNADTGYTAGRSPNGYVGSQHGYFDDITSLAEKVSAAKQAGFGGITYWTIGDEADQPAGQTFFQMVRSYFPQQ